MAERDFIPGFQADHRAVIDGLLDIQTAVQENNMPRAREVLGKLDQMVGPHFKFEDEYLYPALRRFLGERMDEMLKEHDGAVQVALTLAQLFQKEPLSQQEREKAVSELSRFFIHAANCDGLVLLAERLSPGERQDLADKFEATKKERVLLTERA